ncbi:cytochrome P450 [Polychaeton citri CBS 116435]|uniref:Cytochrome P450 n=1 Tax=Polychaeton citri CBS 116435 TaxID=1314669 RepID=A0A9P4UN12_9PEZI|nr:cytochrome P450 [Polychaeton citri CBS 116435]
MALLSLVVLATVVVVFLVARYNEARKKNPTPANAQKLPGPKGLPVIGSVHELPGKCSWMKFHEWGQQYGPIYQVNLAGSNHVWISSDKIAHDLLSKRSGIYSDRPFIPALEQDNRTSGQYLPLMSRNEKWTRQRKFAKQIMDNSQKASFFNYPEVESVRLLFELMADPSRYNHHLESFIARVTSRLAWGTSAPSEELKQRARELLIGVSPTGALGNKLPFIMSLPEKLAAAKAWESRRSRTERKFFETMLEEVAQGLEKAPTPLTPGVSVKQSWTSMFLKKRGSWGFSSDLEGAFAVGMHGIAGALTIAAPMQSFCLALCHYPQYQPILHEEIDRVLGDRMPTYEDMPDMPVLRAFIRETLRWRPPVPTGIPHESTQDDVYEGYFIPKGSVMHPLEWSISRDPEMFPEPDAWNPLRWLNSNFPTYQEPLAKYPTITSYSQFGYGRRTCQGMGVTEADLFVGIGSIAWLFSMETVDESIDMSTRSATPDEIHTPTSDDDCAERFDLDALDAIQRKLMPLSNDSGVDLAYDSHGANSDLPTPPMTPAEEKTMRFPSGLRTLKLVKKVEHQRTRSWATTPPETPAVELPSLDLPVPSTIPTTGSAEPIKSADGSYDTDPTMNFSTLLIAKPLPFKFRMQIRNPERAEVVTKQWTELKMKGEFEDARVYWKGGNAGDAQHGWGEVFS